MLQLPEDEAISFINTVVDLSSVKRFHGHRIINEQSVSDHSARVGMLAFMLALEYYGNDSDAYRVSTYALFHDTSESILKNDLNSTVKAKYGIREILNKLEHEVVTSTFSSNTTASAIIRNLMLENCSDNDHKLLKLADTLDFGLYVWEEVGLGNSHMKPLFSSFIREYTKYPSQFTSLPTAILVYKKILS